MTDEDLHRRIRSLERKTRVLEQRLARSERARGILTAQRRQQTMVINRVVGDLHRAREAAHRAGEVLEQRVLARTLNLVRRNQALRSAKDEAIRASQAKSTFLASMSHELRTPLNSIIGYSELIKEEAAERGDSEHDAIRDVERIHRAARHLLALINDILDLSKIEAGQATLYVEPVDLDELIDEVADTITPLVERNGNRFDLGHKGPRARLIGDRTKLRQILLNLGSNAAKFTRDGNVRLTVLRHPTAIEFSIADTGIGIDTANFHRLFAAFSQAEGTTSRDYGGTGLGLALTHKLCMLMGGDISVESQPGVGSTFTVYVPHAPPKPPALDTTVDDTGATLSPPQPGTTGTILVIDDDESAHAQLRDLLLPLGMRFVATSDFVRGRELALIHQPRIIIVDPLVSAFVDKQGDQDAATPGWEMITELERAGALEDSALIILTALARESPAAHPGLHAYLGKPVNPAFLCEAIHVALTDKQIVHDD